MKRSKIEKIQLVLPPPNRSDTTITKLSKLPQPLARYAQQFVFKLAEMALNRESFALLLGYLSQLGSSDEKDKPGCQVRKMASTPGNFIHRGRIIKKEQYPTVEVRNYLMAITP